MKTPQGANICSLGRKCSTSVTMLTSEKLISTPEREKSLFFNQRTTTPQFTPKIELTTLYTFDIG
jgi:hypothetical protein